MRSMGTNIEFCRVAARSPPEGNMGETTKQLGFEWNL